MQSVTQPLVGEAQRLRTCFVVMGFGEKTDFQTQRKLDLDKSYRTIIKRAVEAAGLKCVRADDIMHAGIIDKPMYELLLNADVVVADLSTSNANAIYELGVRHALRPNTTIVIAEKEFKFPFDLGHLLIRPYEHLGKGIDAEEAERMRAELTNAIKSLSDGDAIDSPVYTFLNGLKRPTLSPAEVAASVAATAPAAGVDVASTALLETALAARAEGDFVVAKALLQKLRQRRPQDPFIIQQLAMVTYKSKQPNPMEALLEAQRILEELKPHSSCDRETLGLWGAINKRLWELRSNRTCLDEAIWAYERGFYLRNDSYTGINYAFLLNVRAATSDRANAISDFVIAQRVRQRVIKICTPLPEEGVKDDDGNIDPAETFWLLATLVEAYVGSMDEARAEQIQLRAQQLQPEAWMLETLREQLAKLRPLLLQQAQLLKF